MRLVMCADVAKKMEKYERVCLRLNEDRFAFHFIRSLYFKMIDGTDKHMNPLFWTLMNKVPPTNRQQKFILRQLIKNPNHLSLLKISSNYSLVASSYKFALAQYELAYHSDPDNYLLCLSVAIVYCNLSLQKHSLHRNTLVLQSIAFLQKYLHLRGVCQESYYNVGRLFHQLGLLHYACLYYEKVLILEPDNHNKLTGSKQYISQRLAMADMRREAAFNLSLIYKNSGNEALALHYLTQYCTI